MKDTSTLNIKHNEYMANDMKNHELKQVTIAVPIKVPSFTVYLKPSGIIMKKKNRSI